MSFISQEQAQQIAEFDKEWAEAEKQFPFLKGYRERVHDIDRKNLELVAKFRAENRRLKTHIEESKAYIKDTLRLKTYNLIFKAEWEYLLGKLEGEEDEQ